VQEQDQGWSSLDLKMGVSKAGMWDMGDLADIS
jgi:hypothetical protein